MRTIEVQTELLHGAVPSSQNRRSEMAVNETGSNARGTGPPAGPPGGAVCAEGVDVEAALCVLALCVLAGAVEVVPPSAGGWLLAGVDTGWALEPQPA
ncbi:MAG TPA: hypothetical protein VE992_02030, partial [Solirubrobacteraceae bacterium]|nr:hypothetical protein [Solirubrobacteraceae bacterium]